MSVIIVVFLAFVSSVNASFILAQKFKNLNGTWFKMLVWENASNFASSILCRKQRSIMGKCLYKIINYSSEICL